MAENEGSGGDQTDAAQREESQAMGVGGVMTPAQTRGAVGGIVIGAVVGVLIGVAIGLIPFGDIETGLRMMVTGGVGLVAGSIVGALLGGFFKPDAEGETGTLPGEPERDIAKRRSGKAE